MDVKFTSEYEILTEHGWEDFSGIKRSETDELMVISLSDGTNIRVTTGHLLKTKDSGFIAASDISIGTELTTGVMIESIDNIKERIFVYDALEVENGNEYITGSVTSHNCAFVPRWDEFSASVLPTLSSGNTTKMIFTSTPNGLNHFYRYCEDAKRAMKRGLTENDFYYIEVPWYRVPGRDEAWRIKVLSDINNDLTKFRQEYECQFIGSGNTLISGEALKNLSMQDPIFDDANLKLKIYEHPEPTNKYILTVDVARGTNNDFSAISIIDVSTFPYRQVACVRDNAIFPHQLGEVVVSLARAYNNGYILVENNDAGSLVCQSIVDLEYQNMFSTFTEGKELKISYGLSAQFDHQQGVRTTKKTKRIGCIGLKNLIESQKLVIIDADTIMELSRFVRKGESFQADEGANDDLAMSLVLFAWLVNQPDFVTFSAEYRDMKHSDQMGMRDKILNQLTYGYSESDSWQFGHGDAIIYDEVPGHHKTFDDMISDAKELLGMK